MSEISFSPSRYDGPATVNGVEFRQAHLWERFEPDGDGLLKLWEGVAKVSRDAAPQVSLDWATSVGPVHVRLPAGGSGTAYITDMALGDGTWTIELTGAGPSPMA